MKEKMAEMTKANEQTLAEAEDHRQTCEKYRIDLEVTLRTRASRSTASTPLLIVLLMWELVLPSIRSTHPSTACLGSVGNPTQP